MRNSAIRKIALAATALTSLLAVPALARGAQGAEGASAGDIIVTARRTEEKLQDVPISITVFNQEQLAARNIASSTDLAAYTPSLTVNSRYGPEKSSFAIRGFSQDLNTLPSVAVYFADAIAPRLASNITSGNGAGPGSMFDLQNVQVLKGPQGTLFGRNTTGGAILLVPRKPSDNFEGYVEGTIGNYGAKRVEAVVNIPLSDRLRIRAGVDRYVRDGYIHNQSGIGPEDFNNVNYFAARVSVLADLSDSLENYTIFTYNNSDTHGVIGRYAFCNRGTVAGSDGNAASALISRAANCAELDRQTNAGFGYYDVMNTNPDPFIDAQQWQAINTTTWEASDNLTIKNIFSYAKSKERYSFNLAGEFVARPYVVTYPGPVKPQGHQWTLSEELQFQGSLGDGKIVWQAGGYMERSAPVGGKGQEQWTAFLTNCPDAASVYAFRCGTGTVALARNNYSFQNYGIYAQATYKFTDQFAVTAGIRNTWDRLAVDAENLAIAVSPNGPVSISCSRAVTPVNPLAPAANTNLLTNGACGIGRSFQTESNRPTWLIDLEYKPTSDILVYGKYARGYRGGGVNESNVGIEAWLPEKVESYELGVKTSFDGAVSGTFNLAGFWNDFTDQQASVFFPACVRAGQPGGRDTCTNGLIGINGIQNVGRSRLRGIEADASVQVGDNLRFDIGYAYLEAVITGSSLPTICDITRYECSQVVPLTIGTILPYAPKNRVTMTATYTLPVDPGLGTITIGATFTYTDKQFSNHGNDRAFGLGIIPYNASIAPATDLLNLNLNWKDVGGSPIDLALFATNVTNQKYYVANANSLASNGAEFLILGQPRMFGARVKFRFGN